LNKFENQENYNCRITTDTGEEYLVYSTWLHNEQLDQWQGWHCDAGATRLFIDKNFDVYSGECRNDYLGNAIDGFNLLEHAVCQQERCSGCTDDLVVAKHKT
jgi:hypothetical protein